MRNGILTVKELVERASSDDWLNRCRAASNRQTPIYWLTILASDESRAVRYRALQTLAHVIKPQKAIEQNVTQHFTASIGLNRDAVRCLQKEIPEQQVKLKRYIKMCDHRPKPMTDAMRRHAQPKHHTQLPHLGPAICRYCGTQLGWKCNHSPVGFCKIKNGYCIHCGRPDIRHTGKFDPTIHDKSDPENVWNRR